METKHTMETETGLREESEKSKRQQAFVRRVVMETFEKKIDPKWKPPPSGMQVTSSSQGYENAFNMNLRSETKSNKFNTSRLK